MPEGTFQLSESTHLPTLLTWHSNVSCFINCIPLDHFGYLCSILLPALRKVDQSAVPMVVPFPQKPSSHMDREVLQKGEHFVSEIQHFRSSGRAIWHITGNLEEEGLKCFRSKTLTERVWTLFFVTWPCESFLFVSHEMELAPSKRLLLKNSGKV